MIIINGMRECSSYLQAPDLDHLRPGTICLTVPLVDDVIQVGIGGDYPTTVVAVSVTASSVRVRRLDGRRLQVHIVEDWRGANHPGTATPVFGEPVEALVLELSLLSPHAAVTVARSPAARTSRRILP